MEAAVAGRVARRRYRDGLAGNVDCHSRNDLSGCRYTAHLQSTMRSHRTEQWDGSRIAERVWKAGGLMLIAIGVARDRSVSRMYHRGRAVLALQP